MVFCNYIERTEDVVKYAYGATPEDITGLFAFDFIKKELKIIKPPTEDDAPIRHLHSLLRINQNLFDKGIFKEKMSYESA